MQHGLFIRYANDNLIFIQYMYLILEELKSFCSSLKCTFYNHKIKLVDHRYGHHSEKKHDLLPALNLGVAPMIWVWHQR